jgi:GNAT superfamily N-acetyltransferase
MILVQRYADGDRDAVAAMILHIQQREFGVPITLDEQPDLRDVPGHYGDAFWVARDGAEVVGTIGLLDAGGVHALRKMFVRADRRGAGFGVANALIDALLAHARTRGVGEIWLGTRPDMHAAHRFYEKHGFARVDERALPAAFPRMAVDSVFYRRAC